MPYLDDEMDCTEENHTRVCGMMAEIFNPNLRSVAMVWGEGQAGPAWNINLSGNSNPLVGETLLETTNNLNDALKKYGEYEAFHVKGLKIWLPTDRIRTRIQFSIRKKISMGEIILEEIKLESK